MVISFLYIILAILALTFLIFIHELGHYWMARRVGMKVETFSIGFGQPIYSWEREGVKWQIGWLPFGGYVKIAGMETDDKTDPYAVKDGFFGKSALDRIKVLFMGPFVNIVFAFIAFSFLWVIGGRVKNFAEYTHNIGWVDPKSEIYKRGLRPGDEIVSYGSLPYQSAGDHLFGPMTSGDTVTVTGFHKNYLTNESIPFSYTVETYPHPGAVDKGVLTGGILLPANYIIYNKLSDGKDNPLVEGSPLKDSGIEYGDRVVWVDGELVFSLQQLHELVNDGNSLLTVKRGNEIFLRRVPRVKVQELKLNSDYKDELIDWKFESHVNGKRLTQLFMIPYVVSDDNVIENRIKLMDSELEMEVFPKVVSSVVSQALQPGDRILAVDGTVIDHGYQLFEQIQQKRLNIIVERDPSAIKRTSWKKADEDFGKEIDSEAIKTITGSIGRDSRVESSGDFVLLKPVVPKVRSSFALSQESQALFRAEIQEQRKEIESIDDSERRMRELRNLERINSQLLIGLPGIQDRKVDYNPGPFVLFKDVAQQIWRMLTALVTGSTSPKWLSGPIGIVHAVKEQSMSSIREMLFWLGAISLNLGVLNLMPLPPFDGGGIVIAFSELVTGRRLKAKTMERLVYPFAVLLIAFFLFVTYHDITRIFGRFFKW